MSIAARLTAFSVFDHLDEEHRKALADAASIRRFGADTTIHTEGETIRDLHLVDLGEVRVCRDTPYGLFPLAELGPGSLFGEPSHVGAPERSGNVVTLSDTALVVFDRDRLAGAAASEPKLELGLHWALWKSLSEKLREANEHLSEFFAEEGEGLERHPVAAQRLPPGSFEVDMDRKREVFDRQGLSRMEINFLSSLSKEKRFAPGEVVFREGDEGDAMYVVLGGQIRISKMVAGAGEEALAFVGRGDFFGEMALIDDRPRSATATAHESGALALAIPREVLQGILDIGKVSSLRLLRILSLLVAKRLRDIDDKLVGWFILAGGERADTVR